MVVVNREIVYPAISTRTLVLGIAGALSATMTDAADFLIQIPFDMVITKMKATAKVAPSGAAAIQLRRSTNATAPAYSDVTGFVTTFVSGQSSAIVDPADVNVNEGDLLNISVSTGSGTNIVVEVVGYPR